jgi:CRISPR/Cas system CSM-associated protein Csm3 (group 7 of RAMP superfamily)
MTTYTLKGEITTLEPLTVSMPGLKRGNVSVLPRNGASEAPYFPASSIRGALRHAAHRAVLRLAKKHTGQSHPFGLNEHFMLAQGVDAARVTKGESGSGQIDFGKELRNANPMLSAFGRWGLESNLSVGNALPETNGCWSIFGGGARSVSFERDTSLLEELTSDDQERLQKIMLEMTAFSVDNTDLKAEESALKKSLKTAGEDERDAVFKRLEEIETIRKTLKSEKEGPEESIRRPIDGYEGFSIGASLAHRMMLRNSNENELGLLLAALAEFAREPRLGGHKSHNSGLISMRYTVTTWPVDEDKPIELGKISLTEDGFSVKGDALIKAREAFLQNSKEMEFTRLTA